MQYATFCLRKRNRVHIIYLYKSLKFTHKGFPGGPVKKNLPTCAGKASSVLGSGRSFGGEIGNPLQHSCWKNPMDRGSWRVIVHGVAKSRTQFECLSTHLRVHTPKNLRAIRGWLLGVRNVIWVDGGQGWREDLSVELEFSSI